MHRWFKILLNHVLILFHTTLFRDRRNYFCKILSKFWRNMLWVQGTMCTVMSLTSSTLPSPLYEVIYIYGMYQIQDIMHFCYGNLRNSSKLWKVWYISYSINRSHFKNTLLDSASIKYNTFCPYKGYKIVVFLSWCVHICLYMALWF